MQFELGRLHPDPTPKQRELVLKARALGQEKFAPRAEKYDREGAFPFENYDDLREAGFLGLTIPERFGGLGADFETYCMVSAELGRWCGTTALTFNMHAATLLWSNQMADDMPMSDEVRKTHEKRRAMIYEKVIDGGSIFAQPFSEPNTAAAAGKSPFGTTAQRTDGGWIVNGVKHFASLSGAAHYYGLLCTEDKGPDEVQSAEDTMYLAVPADSDGVTISGEWDVLGMRGTVSKTITFKDVFVPEDNMVLPTGMYYHGARYWPHMFTTLCPTYLGLSQAAFDFTINYLVGNIEGGPPKGGEARLSPAKQMSIAEMRVKLEQSKALFYRVIKEARYNPSKPDRLRAYCSQITVMEGANDICRLAIRTCGGRTIFKKYPLERYYRDSRCGSLMLPWTPEICMERLGRESVQDPGEVEPLEQL